MCGGGGCQVHYETDSLRQEHQQQQTSWSGFGRPWLIKPQKGGGVNHPPTPPQPQTVFQDPFESIGASAGTQMKSSPPDPVPRSIFVCVLSVFACAHLGCWLQLCQMCNNCPSRAAIVSSGRLEVNNNHLKTLRGRLDAGRSHSSLPAAPPPSPTSSTTGTNPSQPVEMQADRLSTELHVRRGREAPLDSLRPSPRAGCLRGKGEAPLGPPGANSREVKVASQL